jgi:ABC-type Zn uptake system ZnuABC Zn-binding protein ZnuA
VQSLIAPGADPEAFEPRPAHLVALREARLVIRVGAGYEHWLDRLIQQAGKPHLRPGADGYLDASGAGSGRAGSAWVPQSVVPAASRGSRKASYGK